MPYEQIYSTDIFIPLPKEGEYIEDWGASDPKEQYWRMVDLPDFITEVEYDKDGNVLLDEDQTKYAREEVRRCKEGFFFMNNGVITYITGKHYFYLKFWKLEDDVYADYRDVDRRYFLFLNHWEKIPFCLGVVRGKKRREGATSQATSNLIYECIFYKNSFCGLTSKTQIDAKAAFTNMVSFGYRQLPAFLKPKQLNNKDSVSELVFAHKSVENKSGKGSTIDTDTGHRSKVDYRAPSINAYDSLRISRILIDESAKFPKEVPVSTFISIVSKTMVQGVRRVGFMECPSTTNAMENGGAEFKLVWESANQFKYERTPNRLVKYMTPAYDGYVGFIDRYGMSVIDKPTEDQYKYLVENYVGIGDLTEEDVRLGAKEYLLKKRSLLEGSALEEEIRMNPFDEKEMFRSSGKIRLYDTILLNDQLDFISAHTGEDSLTEKGNLVWKDGHKYYKEIKNDVGDVIGIEINELIWVPNENGKFEKVKGWEPKEKNNVIERNGFFMPNGNYAMRIGCDPFKYDKTKDNRRSDCAAYGYQMPNDIGNNNEFDDMFCIRYVERAATTDIQYDNVLKLAWYCGCQVLFERNVENWKKYFNVEKCSGFLMWLPGEVEPGIYTDGSGNVVQTICDLTEAYHARAIKKVYFRELIGEEKGWLGFDVGNTQVFDEPMGAGFALIAATAKKYKKEVGVTRSIDDILPYRKAV